MKNNQKGFSAIEALIVLIFLGLIAGVGWFVWQKSGRSDNSTSEPAAGEYTSNNENMADDEQIPAGFIKYSNESLGLTFAYPNEWGSVEFSEKAGLAGLTKYFEFSNEPKMNLDGHTKNYQTEPRGGGYVDYGGFVKDGNKFKLRYYDGKPISITEGYELNSPKNCLVRYDKVNEVMGPTYHAACNLNTADMYGVNFYYSLAGDATDMSFTDFKKMIDTVKIN